MKLPVLEEDMNQLMGALKDYFKGYGIPLKKMRLQNVGTEHNKARQHLFYNGTLNQPKEPYVKIIIPLDYTGRIRENKSVECQIAEQHANGLQEIISSWAASSRMRRGDAPLPIEYKLLEYEAARKAA